MFLKYFKQIILIYIISLFKIKVNDQISRRPDEDFYPLSHFELTLLTGPEPLKVNDFLNYFSPFHLKRLRLTSY